MKILSPEMILINIEVDSWEDAVRTAGNILVNNHKATPSYIDGMINLANELGPYIVMTPGVAIPHARPEEGALDVGIAAVKLCKPIKFGNQDNDPVYLVLAFCTPNANAHIELLSKIAEILSQEDLLEKVKRIETPQQLIDLFDLPDHTD